MKAIIFIITGILFFNALHAQRVCGTEAYLKSLPTSLVASPSGPSGPSRDTLPNEVLVIPVVIHVLYYTNGQNISDAQILSQLNVLNQDFRRRNADTSNTPAVFKAIAADAGITFCLAQVDPNGRTTTGIIRKKTTRDFFLADDEMKFSNKGGDNAWDASKYMNIWICSMLGRNLGYATLPGGAADKDGIVINYDVFGTVGAVRAPFNKGRTATHEVAHWLGLKHIWGEDNCGTDDVDDTPKQETYNYNCPSFPSRSSCSPNASGDMFMNFMDFTDDACMNIFTQGQKNKMRGLFALNNKRNSFLNSYACDSSLAAGGPLPDSIPLEKPGLQVGIYPNPAYDNVSLMVNENYSLAGWQLIVINALGVKQFEQTLQSNMDLVSVKQLKAGIYFIYLTDGKTKKILRLVKVN